MLKRFLASLGAAVLAVTGLLPASPALAAAVQFIPESIVESRSLSVGTPFIPEANDTSVEIRVELSIAQAALTGSTTDVYRVRGTLTQGTDVISLEESVNFENTNFWNRSFGSNSANPKEFSSSSNQTVRFSLSSTLIQGKSYTVGVELTKNGTLLSSSSDYTVSSVNGNFFVWGNSVKPSGNEVSLRFSGAVCVPASAISALSVGDQLEFTMADSSSRSYSLNNISWENSGSSSRYTQSTVSVQEGDLVSGIRIMFEGYVSASGLGVYDPSVSVTKVGDSEQLATECLSAPSAAPTMSATTTSITMQVTLNGAERASCLIAQKDNPKVPVASSSFSPFPGAGSTNTSCFFSGLKRDEYVGWYFLEGNFYESGPQRIRVSSGKSPVSTAIAYEGGNASFPTYSGSEGGTGQGSLQIKTVPNAFFDYATAGFRFYGGFVGNNQTPGRSSDGNGGLLIASVEGPVNELTMRRLTDAGQDMNFAGNGTAEIDILPIGRYAGAPNVAWYGTVKDKWILELRPQYLGYNSALAFSETVQLVYGTYTGGQQGSALLSDADVSAFCSNAIVDDSNESFSGYVERIISSPTAEPTILISCGAERFTSSRYHYSQLYYLASLNASGHLVLKHALSAEPTDAEPCSRTSVSGVNSGATGSEVLIASYQVSWLPSSDCFSQNLSSSVVTSRDVFKILASTSTVNVDPVEDVLTNDGTTEPLPSDFEGIGLIVSGPNVFLNNVTQLGFSGNFMFSGRKYQIAVLDQDGKFGEITTIPFMAVGTETEFSGFTSFTQIVDYSENDSTSLLLLRQDDGFSDRGTTAARVSMSDGSVVSYRQMVSGASGGDGFSTAVGNSLGELNFFGIKSRTEAVVGTWVTSGTLDPGLAALPVNQGAANTGVSDSGGQGGTPPPTNNQETTPAAPYTGPVLNTSAITGSVAAGGKLVIPGENLEGVTAAEVGGLAAAVVVNSDGELEITVPAGLAAGTYDLVVISSSGRLTVQDAITVSGSSDSSGTATPSTKRMGDDRAKVWVFDLVGAGKVQIFVNGKEIAWVNATDANDSKLFNGYLVRTVELKAGKNIVEVFVDGERERRTVYSN